ncbi:MAG: dipicolinate synthase subunit B [Clostridia bacterium]|nr:dipicolinate synthase subunit B [Clostridia bacterium]
MKIGYALTGSFCTVRRSLSVLNTLIENYEIVPIVSEAISRTDTRFGKAEDTLMALTDVCGSSPIRLITEAEPLGPKTPLDAMVICPCTGNTLAKLACGITDSTVTMAAKAHLRQDRPLVIAISTNDALSQNLKNLATLLQRKSVYIVPFGQDDPINKPHSLISDFSLTEKTLSLALQGKQLQPLLI